MESNKISAKEGWLVAIEGNNKFLWFSGSFRGWSRRMQKVNTQTNGVLKIRESIPGEKIVDLGD